MPESDYREKVERTQNESSTAEEPAEGGAPARDPAETAREKGSRRGAGTPPGSSGDEDDYETEDGR